MLKEIIAAKKRQLASIDLSEETNRLKSARLDYPESVSLADALSDNENISLIAEIKRRSPSRGLLNKNIDVASLVETYQRAGASAISILTETEFFDGSLDDLQTARKTTNLPLLRKDFILTEYQIWESKASGADAILLIASCLDTDTIVHLIKVSSEAGVEPLIEIHTVEELNDILPLAPRLIAINNRNLQTFEVDLSTIGRLIPMIPEGTLIVSASGVFNRSEVEELASLGVNAVLVGEALVTATDPSKTIAHLLGAKA